MEYSAHTLYYQTHPIRFVTIDGTACVVSRDIDRVFATATKGYTLDGVPKVDRRSVYLDYESQTPDERSRQRNRAVTALDIPTLQNRLERVRETNAAARLSNWLGEIARTPWGVPGVHPLGDLPTGWRLHRTRVTKAKSMWVWECEDCQPYSSHDAWGYFTHQEALAEAHEHATCNAIRELLPQHVVSSQEPDPVDSVQLPEPVPAVQAFDPLETAPLLTFASDGSLHQVGEARTSVLGLKPAVAA